MYSRVRPTSPSLVKKENNDENENDDKNHGMTIPRNIYAASSCSMVSKVGHTKQLQAAVLVAASNVSSTNH